MILSLQLNYSLSASKLFLGFWTRFDSFDCIFTIVIIILDNSISVILIRALVYFSGPWKFF